MVNKTLLQYVQTTLSLMDSDEVDGITETTESLQVANLMSEVYYELMERQEWEFTKGAVTLTAQADVNNPTAFNVPESMRRLMNVWYNIATDGTLTRRELKWIEPTDFLLLNSKSSGDTKLITLGDQIQFYVRTDRMPTYYTTFDDQVVWMDAYDTSVETTLQQTKISAWGVSIPTFEVTDEFIPSIPKNMVPLLQSMLNKAAFAYYKQAASGEDVEKTRRQMAQQRRRNGKTTPREYYYSNQFGRR